jgi:hypothetical protein
MKSRFLQAFVLSAVALLLLSAPASARGKKAASTEPGTYKEWKGEIDEIQILKKFAISDYKTIVVRSFETSEVKLPEKDDNTYEPVKKVLESPETAFAKGLKADLAEGRPLAVEISKAKGPGTLVIDAVVEEMDPGSKAARYWAGFGAGAARAKLSLTISDGATGDVLIKFTQERRSGVGMMGGDYVGLMNKNLDAIGKDCAFILNEF